MFGLANLFRDRSLSQVFERRRQFTAAVVPVALGRVANRVDAGGLLDNHNFVVEMPNHEAFNGSAKMNRRGLAQNFENFAFFQSPSRIKTESVVDVHAPT